MNKKEPTLWDSGRRSQEQKKPSGSPLSPQRGVKGEHNCPAPVPTRPAPLGSALPQALRRPALPKACSHENEAGPNNQTLDSVLPNSGFQINCLESKVTRKPRSLLNLNIIDSVVSFESQKWTHFETGSRDCVSMRLRNEKANFSVRSALVGRANPELPSRFHDY